MKIKNNSKEYIMLYMGVSNKHRGLGSAIAKTIVDELKANNATSIGALIRQGKATNNYIKGKIINKYEYILLKRDIS